MYGMGYIEITPDEQERPMTTTKRYSDSHGYAIVRETNLKEMVAIITADGTIRLETEAADDIFYVYAAGDLIAHCSSLDDAHDSIADDKALLASPDH